MTEPISVQRDKRDERNFERVRALLTEYFDDHLVIVRNHKGGKIWSASDPNWGLGAARRFGHMVEERDRMYEQDRDIEENT